MELLAEPQEDPQEAEDEEEEELEIQLKDKDIECLCNAVVHRQVVMPKERSKPSYAQIVAMVLDEFARNRVEVVVVKDGAHPPLKEAVLALRR